jgi:hypothetical protein
MARGSGYNIGSIPPQIAWTVVSGDTASFKVYVTDDARQPLNIPDWTLAMQIKRPNIPSTSGVITEDSTLIFAITPYQGPGDTAGEFTVALNNIQTELLQTGDFFDIQLSKPGTVWTVAQGKMIMIEDVTDN